MYVIPIANEPIHAIENNHKNKFKNILNETQLLAESPTTIM